MNNIQMFIELLKLEARKAEAVANYKEQGQLKNEFQEAQKLRAAAFLEVIDWADLLLKNTENENGGKKDASNDGKPM